MLRDGRDIAFSIRKAGWAKSMIEAADYWQERVKLGKAGGKLLDRERYREVYYEQLVMEPEETLRDLCTWLVSEVIT